MANADLNRLAIFARVVEAGGFTAAAERLGMVKSQVSQQVARLEAELGIALLTRTTRRVMPTEAGEALYADLAPALAAVDAALSRLDAGGGVLEGRLRLTAPTDYASEVLGSLIGEFAKAHPALELELVATDKVLDLVGEGIDLGLRVGFLRDSSMRSQRLGSFAQVVVAAPDFWRQQGAPNHPEQLHGAPWVAMTALPAPLSWQFEDGQGGRVAIKARAVLRVNSANVARECAKAGAGYTVLPDFMIGDDLAAGRLIAPMAGWHLPVGGIHAVYPANRYLPPKVRRFVDFLRERL